MSPRARDRTTRSPGVLQPLVAGAVASLVGFASTFALVLAGLRAVGADADQAASGLLALCLLMGVVAIALGVRYRMPIAIAWSTPGAALLISAGAVPGGYRAALGAFLAAGAMIVLAGLWRPLGRGLAAIPPALANAMLAGVLLPVCLAPARAVVELPWQAGPVVVAWALLARFAPRWAVPGALAVTVVVIAVGEPVALHDQALPTATFTLPAFDVGALVGLAIPLFVVTMASQNVPGMSVLASYGYRPPLRPVLVSTGAATAAGAPFGAHAINLAAITAALVAGPQADPDRARRWIASVGSGVVYLGLGLTAGHVTAVVAAAPTPLIETVAGLALMGALGAALAAAFAAPAEREAAAVTLVVSASAITALGISAAFWGLLAGLGLLALRRAGSMPEPAGRAEPARERGPA